MSSNFERRWRRLAVVARRAPERPLPQVPASVGHLLPRHEAAGAEPTPWNLFALAAASALSAALALPWLSDSLGEPGLLTRSLPDLPALASLSIPRPPRLPPPPSLPDVVTLVRTITLEEATP